MHIGDLTREQLKATRNIGYNLKERRENLGYTLDYVAEIIRISVHTIQQLEEGNYTFFRNMVFLKGTLRNYCNFMKISPSNFLEEIDNLFIKIPAVTEPIEKPKKKILQSSFFLNLSISFLVIIGFGVGIYFLFFNNFDKTNTITTPQKNIKPAEPVILEPLANKQLILSLTAKKDGWARISTNNQRTFEIYLKKNVDYSWLVEENFQVILSTQDLALVFLNKNPAILLLEEEKNIITTFTLNSF